MKHAESFRDLVVYQKARAVARRFFDLSTLQSIGRMLQAMIDKADQFCGAAPHCIRESEAEYFVTHHRSPITDNW